MASPAEAVTLAAVAALDASSALATVAGAAPVYNGLAPATRARWITVGTPSDGAAGGLLRGVMQGKPAAVSLTFHLWDRDPATAGTTMGVLRMWGPVRDALDEVPLTLAGYGLTYGTARLVSAAPDADGVTMHGVVRYDATVFATS
jgi:hypothetical protein